MKQSTGTEIKPIEPIESRDKHKSPVPEVAGYGLAFMALCLALLIVRKFERELRGNDLGQK